MTLAAFELNDSGLRLRTGAGTEHCEPGLALAQGQDLFLKRRRRLGAAGAGEGDERALSSPQHRSPAPAS